MADVHEDVTISRAKARWATGLTRLVAKSPTVAFLIGTFAWAWVLWGYWIPAMPPGGLEFSRPFLLTAIGGGFAPSLAAIAIAWLLGGGKGVAKLLAPLRQWRLHPGWYGLALLLVPALTLISITIQGSAIGPLEWGDMSALIPIALVWPLLAALGEEIGWRGFLQPRLQPRFGIAGTALVIGIIWGLWHLPADWIGMKAYGDWFLAAFLVNGPIVLTGHAIIMAWLWNRTNGSLLLMVLYHLSITASAILAPAAANEGGFGVLSAGIGAALVWLVALALLIGRRRDFEMAT
jgi:membrane protease YdiL (CAAX protease family)